MKLELEVLASTSIKRKKPWPKVVFVGEVQESLFLVDEELQRLSVLYVPSGKTKRKIPKLTPMLSNVAVITHTDNGHFVAGLLNSGDIFIWHKDSDTIKYVKGLDEFRAKIVGVQPVDEQGAKTTKSDTVKGIPEPYLHVSGDATRAVMVLDHNKIYVWEMDPCTAFFTFDKKNKKKLSRDTHLLGGWTSVMSTADTPLPEPYFKETSIHASFFVDRELFGLCCGITFVYSKNEDIFVSSLFIKWFDSQNITSWSAPVFHSEWSTVKYPLTSISPDALSIRSHGAYVARMSHDGQAVAVAVNQGCSHDNKVLYVSPWTDTVVVADMRGCGARQPVTEDHRSYWVADMCWTYNDLFLACILKQGTLCMLTRLGEPALLQTMGCSLDMGPKPFLPLHPLINVTSADLNKHSQPSTPQSKQLLSASMEEARDVKRQRFSISSHPRLPMIIFSDGYMVTILTLPGDPTCLSLMKGLCMESTHHLRKIRDHERIQISLFDSLKKKKQKDEKSQKSSKKSVECDNCGYRLGLVVSKNLAMRGNNSNYLGKYVFETAPQEVLNTDYESDAQGDVSGQVRDLGQGNLDFGNMDNLNTTLDYRRLAQDEGLTVPELISRAQMALMLAWNLAASHIGLWTLEHETIVDNVADNLIQLFSVLLQSSPKVLKKLGNTVTTILDKTRYGSINPKKVNKQLVLVLKLFKSVMHTLRFDTHSRHLMVCSTKFTHSAVSMLLKHQNLSLLEPRSKTLHGCYIVLSFAEDTLSRIYTSVNGHQPYMNGSIHHEELTQSDAYQPAIFVYTAQGRESLLNSAIMEVAEDDVDDDDQTEVKKMLQQHPSNNGMMVPCHKCNQDGVVSVELKGVKRLGIAWLILYKTAVENYKAVKDVMSKNQQGGLEGKALSRPKIEMKKIWSLIMLVETKVHALGLNLPAKSTLALTEAENKLVEGDTEKGQMLMVKELGNAPDPKIKGTKGCRLLLSMIYNLLAQGQIRSALELTEFLIRQSDVKKAIAMSRQDTETKMALLSLLQQVPSKKRSLPLCTIQNSAVRHTVQSMARLMASYFSNRELFVYPPHTPKKLPPLHLDYQIEDRIIPINREELTSQLTEASLGDVWTTDKTLEYLLLCGALPEAVWLASSLGDWKTAFVIAVATVQHQDMCSVLYSKYVMPVIEKNKLQLPMHLHPENILKDKLETIIAQEGGASDKEIKEKFMIDEETNPEHLISSLNEFLIASSLCRLDLLPWLLDGLTRRLKLVTRRFSAIVPDSLYLPAPPVYCPQPTPTNESRIPKEVLDEIHLRREVSSLVQTILLVLQASNTCLPAARWYIQQLMEAFRKGLKYKKNKEADRDLDIRVIQESFLSLESIFNGQEKHGEVHVVLESFREMCTVVWMLHARDQLSKALRKKTYIRQKMLKRTADVTKSQWQEQCQNALNWARHMMPYSYYLSEADLDLASVLFSLVIEMKGDDESAKILAEQFWDPEYVHPEIHEKMQWLLKDWQKIILTDKPRSIPLSVYYDKACHKFERVVNRKEKTFGAFDQFVYKLEGSSSTSIEVDETLYIGSRPFETEEAFLKFMDDFYAISFNKLIDKENDSQTVQQPPLLPSYAKEIRQKELNSQVHQAVSSFQRKQTTSEAIHKTQSPQMSPKNSAKVSLGSPKKKKGAKNTGSKSGKAKRGLFRSRSFSELRGSSVPLFEQSPSKSKKRVSSHDDIIDDSIVLDLPPITPRGEGLNASKLSVNTPRHRTSTPRKGKKQGLTTRKRSSSVTNLNSKDFEGTDKPAPLHDSGSDPLAVPILEPWILENMVFEKKYAKLERLLDWLNRWASRGNVINAFDSNNIASPQKSKYLRQQSVMRIRVPTRIILYSLWQLEQTYVTVSEYHSHAGLRSSHHEPVSTISSSHGEGRKRQQLSSRRDFDPEITEEVPEVTTVTPNVSNVVESMPQEKQNRKEMKQRKSKKSKRQTEIPEKEVLITRENNDIVQSNGILPHLRQDMIKANETTPVQTQAPTHRETRDITARKKKQLKMRDKSLNVILNEQFVADMNTNQNNANDDTHVSTEPNTSVNDSSTKPAGQSQVVSTVSNRNQNNSTLGRNSEESSAPSGGYITEEDIGKHVGKMVAQRMQEGQLGQSTDALISSLSEMIDDELKKTMKTLARFDNKGMGSAVCPSKAPEPVRYDLVPEHKVDEVTMQAPMQLTNTESTSRTRPDISNPIPLDTPDGAFDEEGYKKGKTISPPSTITPNMTLPFGGTGGGGGMTDRSLLSNNSSIAEELRSVVRTELKKLIEAQHKGILTMLNTLDEPDAKPTGPHTYPPKQQLQHKQSAFDPFDPHGTGRKEVPVQPQECVVLTAQQQQYSSSGLSPSVSVSKKTTDEDYDPTLTPVSSLSSELFTDRTPLADQPLTVSELTKEVPHEKRTAVQVHGALKELKDLENKHHNPHYHHHQHHHPHHGHHGNHHHHSYTQQQKPTSGKENQPITPGQSEPMFSTMPFSAYGPPLLHHESNTGQQEQPFGRLMNVLRHFNTEVAGSPRTEVPIPPLLGIPPSSSDMGGVRFPPIPTQAWTENSQGLYNNSGMPPHMPLLHPGNVDVPAHILQEYHKHDIPERDLPHVPNSKQQDTSQSGVIDYSHIPLLHANWGAQPFQNLRDQYGVPRLIPPSELIDYEQRKYNKTAYKKKLLQEKIDKKMREVTGKPETPLGVQLLRADLEPFNERDDRDLEARQRRRQIKLRKPGDKKRKKSKEKHKSKDSGGGDTEPLISKGESQDQSLTDDMTEDLPSDPVSPPVREVEIQAEQKPTVLNHGYALTPGMFDEYLDKDKDLGSKVDSYARLQHQATKMVKDEKKKLSPRKKNAAVGTDVVVDKGTSISKDTGNFPSLPSVSAEVTKSPVQGTGPPSKSPVPEATDPVGEALSRYYRAKTGNNTGNILPPDIYMGLRFTDTQESNTSTKGFLNVVDINSADMLNEIAATVPDRQPHEIEPVAVDMDGVPIQPTTLMKDTIKATRRTPVAAGQRSRSASPRRPGPDQTTLEMLGQPTDSFAPTDEIVAGYRKRTGGHIKKRLMDMDQQFDAIATMTQNIEDDFRTTKVLLHTIEQMGEAIHPQSLPQTSRSPQRSQRTTPRNRGYTDDMDVALRPSFVKKVNKGDPDTHASNTPIASTPRFVADDGLTVDERIKEIRSSIKTDGLRWSGISDIDDIIGEVIAKGDVDATQFGFTQDEVELLTSRALNSARKGEVVNSQELEDIFRKKSPRRRQGRTEAERKQLQEFMENKRREQMKDYKSQLNQLREKETNPYKGSKDKTATKNQELMEADKLRVTSKNRQRNDFSKERERQATHLMRDILEDKVNDRLPIDNRTMTIRSQKSPSSTRRISPLGRTKTLNRTGSPGTGRRAVSASPMRRDPDQQYVHPDEYMLRDSYEYISSGPVRPSSASAAGRQSRIDNTGRPRPMKSDHSPMVQRKSLEFSGEDQIRVYEMDEQLRDITEESPREGNENRPPQKIYKPKPFNEMVKMQDPKKLAKNRNRSHKPVSYVDRLSEMSATSTQRSHGSTLAEQHKMYGSKRLPGTRKSLERTAPRTVKTYQERLREMKQQQQQYSTPIVPRGEGPSQSVPFQPPATTKPRKSKTYTEQLKQLQPPKEMYRTGQGIVSQKAVRRSHGPAHKPKTYTQQLQELQPHHVDPTQHGRVYRGAAPQRSAMRSRPYADPYSMDIGDDRDSVVSPWSMPDDVRNLIYNEEEASFLAPTSVYGTEFDDQMTELDDIPLGGDYISMVEVDELLEVGSGGSVMSFIDWDQIDDLIADVQ